eukprot:1541343-Pleurochrysis_carterae.AAC.3
MPPPLTSAVHAMTEPRRMTSTASLPCTYTPPATPPDEHANTTQSISSQEPTMRTLLSCSTEQCERLQFIIVSEQRWPT